MKSHNLDCLRSIAVLCVFFCHALTVSGVVAKRSIVQLGEIGVLLFFVHTSLVLMFSLERSESDGALWNRFMLRRVFRIYPLSVITTLVTFLFGIPSGTIDPYFIHRVQLTTGGLLSNLALTQNLTFSPSSPAPLWSLPFEVQMYCLLPFLFLAVRKRTSVAWLLWPMSVIAAALFLKYGVTTRIVERASVILYAPCFLAGILAFSNRGSKRRFPAWAWPLAVCSVVSIFLWTPENLWLPRWLCCFGIGLMIPLFRELKQRLITQTSESIAKYSYGIYLGHMACLWVFFIVVKLPALWQWVGSVASTAALAVLMFHLIEQPMIDFGKNLLTKRGTMKQNQFTIDELKTSAICKECKEVISFTSERALYFHAGQLSEHKCLPIDAVRLNAK